MNRNIIVGIAAGAAALAVASIIARRTGALETLLDKIRDLARSMEGFDVNREGLKDMIPKGEDSNISKHLHSN